MRAEGAGGQKMSVFVHAIHAGGGGQKMSKFCPRSYWMPPYINVLSALKWQASLNLSLNSQIEVDTVKNTSFEVILPYRMDSNPIGAHGLNLNKLRVLLLG